MQPTPPGNLTSLSCCKASKETSTLGEETGSEALLRFQAATNRLLEAHPGKTIIAVTHGIVLALLMAKVASIEPVKFWDALGMPAYVVFRLPGFEVVEIVNMVA